MAVTASTSISNNGTQIARWAGDAGAGNGPGVMFGANSKKTVQRVSGAGTYTVEGSNDGVTWGALATTISAINDNNCRPIPENPLLLRVVTATAAATVVIVGDRG
jgi:hypothetical protein